MKRVSLFFGLFLLLALCCTPQAAPDIVNFSISPTQISEGGSATLIWNVTGATSIDIDNGIGQVKAAGIKAVSPSTTTVYTLNAKNAASSVTKSAAIVININNTQSTFSSPPTELPPTNNNTSSNSSSPATVLPQSTPTPGVALSVDVWTNVGGQGPNTPGGTINVGDELVVILSCSSSCQAALVLNGPYTLTKDLGTVSAGVHQLSFGLAESKDVGVWNVTLEASANGQQASDVTTFTVVGSSTSNCWCCRPLGVVSNTTPLQCSQWDGKCYGTEAEADQACQTRATCSIAPTGILQATAGQPFMHQFLVTGCHCPANNWTITGLPWLSIDSNTGVVSGTPTQAGTFSFHVSCYEPVCCSATGNNCTAIILLGLDCQIQCTGQESATCWCCRPLGVVSNTTPSQCSQWDGKCYATQAQAQQVCQAAPTIGTINVNATLNGAPWSGPVWYTIKGPTTVSYKPVPCTFSASPGTYTIGYGGGGPDFLGWTFDSITPSLTQNLTSGATITFTFNFTAAPIGTLNVNATLNGAPWSGKVDYLILYGKYDTSCGAVPLTFAACDGSYSIKYLYSPSGATLDSITPSPTQNLTGVGSITFTLNFR